jgi:hypothetical protein
MAFCLKPGAANQDALPSCLKPGAADQDYLVYSLDTMGVVALAKGITSSPHLLSPLVPPAHQMAVLALPPQSRWRTALLQLDGPPDSITPPGWIARQRVAVQATGFVTFKLFENIIAISKAELLDLSGTHFSATGWVQGGSIVLSHELEMAFMYNAWMDDCLFSASGSMTSVIDAGHLCGADANMLGDLDAAEQAMSAFYTNATVLPLCPSTVTDVFNACVTAQCTKLAEQIVQQLMCHTNPLLTRTTLALGTWSGKNGVSVYKGHAFGTRLALARAMMLRMLGDGTVNDLYGWMYGAVGDAFKANVLVVRYPMGASRVAHVTTRDDMDFYTYTDAAGVPLTLSGASMHVAHWQELPGAQVPTRPTLVFLDVPGRTGLLCSYPAATSGGVPPLWFTLAITSGAADRACVVQPTRLPPASNVLEGLYCELQVLGLAPRGAVLPQTYLDTVRQHYRIDVLLAMGGDKLVIEDAAAMATTPPRAPNGLDLGRHAMVGRLIAASVPHSTPIVVPEAPGRDVWETSVGEVCSKWGGTMGATHERDDLFAAIQQDATTALTSVVLWLKQHCPMQDIPLPRLTHHIQTKVDMYLVKSILDMDTRDVLQILPICLWQYAKVGRDMVSRDHNGTIQAMTTLLKEIDNLRETTSFPTTNARQKAVDLANVVHNTPVYWRKALTCLKQLLRDQIDEVQAEHDDTYRVEAVVTNVLQCAAATEQYSAAATKRHNTECLLAEKERLAKAATEEEERQRLVAVAEEEERQRLAAAAAEEEERQRLVAVAEEEERQRLAAAAAEEEERQRLAAAAAEEEERQRLAAAAAEEEERQRLAAAAEEEERQRLAAAAAEEEERQRLAAAAEEEERQRLAAAAEEEERQRLAAAAAEEEERQRLAAAAEEEERQRLAAAAEEEERQRLAAAAEEEERQRLAAAAAEEGERQRLAKAATEEEERQRLAAAATEEEERQRLAAAAAEEEERQRLAAAAAEEEERQRLAAAAAEEEERQRLAAAAKEEERQRLAAAAAEEEERQRLAAAAAEEEERQRLAAAAAEEEERQRLAAAAKEEERQRLAAAAAKEEARQCLAAAEEEERQRLVVAEEEERQRLVVAEEEERQRLVAAVEEEQQRLGTAAADEVQKCLSAATLAAEEEQRRLATLVLVEAAAVKEEQRRQAAVAAEEEQRRLAAVTLAAEEKQRRLTAVTLAAQEEQKRLAAVTLAAQEEQKRVAVAAGVKKKRGNRSLVVSAAVDEKKRTVAEKKRRQLEVAKAKRRAIATAKRITVTDKKRLETASVAVEPMEELVSAGEQQTNIAAVAANNIECAVSPASSLPSSLPSSPSTFCPSPPASPIATNDTAPLEDAAAVVLGETTNDSTYCFTLNVTPTCRDLVDMLMTVAKCPSRITPPQYKTLVEELQRKGPRVLDDSLFVLVVDAVARTTSHTPCNHYGCLMYLVYRAVLGSEVEYTQHFKELGGFVKSLPHHNGTFTTQLTQLDKKKIEALRKCEILAAKRASTMASLQRKEWMKEWWRESNNIYMLAVDDIYGSVFDEIYNGGPAVTTPSATSGTTVLCKTMTHLSTTPSMPASSKQRKRVKGAAEGVTMTYGAAGMATGSVAGSQHHFPNGKRRAEPIDATPAPKHQSGGLRDVESRYWFLVAILSDVGWHYNNEDSKQLLRGMSEVSKQFRDIGDGMAVLAGIVFIPLYGTAKTGAMLPLPIYVDNTLQLYTATVTNRNQIINYETRATVAELQARSWAPSANYTTDLQPVVATVDIIAHWLIDICRHSDDYLAKWLCAAFNNNITASTLLAKLQQIMDGVLGQEQALCAPLGGLYARRIDCWPTTFPVIMASLVRFLSTFSV